ncbi:MAG: RNA-dependent DNA polymerase, partial [bacterium]|nr:RNA-dependent DNA polymerase [bacterium]
VARFRLDLEWELCRLRRELEDGSYQPGPYRTFWLRDPKPRLISAARFRDRVVHHALTQLLEPVFERQFQPDSFACRKGFGTHKAVARARQASGKYRFVLKCDVRKYFATIDHGILNGLLAKVVKCKRTLDLAGKIIDGSNEQEEVITYFPGDDLFAPYERRRGLPLGNQTSQFFANVYLDPLDQMVKRQLRPGAYMRYVDDFLLFDDSKRRLEAMRRAIECKLEELRVQIHPRKSRVYRGRLVRGNVVGFGRRMRELQRSHSLGEIEWDEVCQRVRAWIAHAAHGETWRLRERLFGQFAFVKGHAG